MISAIFTPVCSLPDTPAQSPLTSALPSRQSFVSFSPLTFSSFCPTFIKYFEDQVRIIVGIKSGLSEVSGSKLGFNSSRSEEENCLSEKAFLVNSIQFQPRWNLTAKQVIKCKVSTRTLKIPTMEMWSFMSIFGIHHRNNSARVQERRDEVLSHCLQPPQLWGIIKANLARGGCSAQHRSHWTNIINITTQHYKIFLREKIYISCWKANDFSQIWQLFCAQNRLCQFYNLMTVSFC